MASEGVRMYKQTEFWAVGLVILSTILSSIASVFLKLGTRTLELKITSLLKNYRIGLGVLFMIFSVIVYMIALKGGQLSVLYPFASLSYVWVTINSKLFLKERISSFKLSGIALIIAGITLIAVSS
ncbi:hypothetical protein BH10BAC5_BH10BAC5_07640 [soil metagenome]